MYNSQPRTNSLKASSDFYLAGGGKSRLFNRVPGKLYLVLRKLVRFPFRHAVDSQTECQNNENYVLPCCVTY